jgi:hypothetical protein
MMKKRVYLIPGFGDSPSASMYARVRKYFRKENISCKLVKIDWEYNSIENYVSQFLLQYKRSENVSNYLFGFSFGALLAFLVTPIINPGKLYMCSISPFFKEDIISRAEFIQSIGKRRWLALKKISFEMLAKDITCKTIIVVGGDELPSVKKRAKAAKKCIRTSQLFIAKGATHNLLDEGYNETLQNIIHKIH